MLEQKQRRLENKIRKLKRLVEGSFDSENIKENKRKLKETQKQLREFISEHSDILRRDYSREKIYTADKPKTVDKSRESDIIKSEGVTELEQAKKRDHKIYITDMAIEKVTNSNVPHYNDIQNQMIDNKHKELLKRAKMFNDSNETAVLFDLSSGEEAIMLGGENSVDIFENPNAVSMANSGRVLFLAHNHPSTQNFSYADIGVFLMNDSINGLSAVSNMGVAHIIAKSDKYDFAKAYEALSDIRRKYDIVDEETNKLIVKEFLKIAKSLGIEYC